MNNNVKAALFINKTQENHIFCVLRIPNLRQAMLYKFSILTTISNLVSGGVQIRMTRGITYISTKLPGNRYY